MAQSPLSGAAQPPAAEVPLSTGSWSPFRCTISLPSTFTSEVTKNVEKKRGWQGFIPEKDIVNLIHSEWSAIEVIDYKQPSHPTLFLSLHIKVFSAPLPSLLLFTKKKHLKKIILNKGQTLLKEKKREATTRMVTESPSFSAYAHRHTEALAVRPLSHASSSALYSTSTSAEQQQGGEAPLSLSTRINRCRCIFLPHRSSRGQRR